MFCHKIRLQEASWAYLGLIWVAKGDQKGAQKRPRSTTRNDKKTKLQKETIFDRFGGPGGCHPARGGGVATKAPDPLPPLYVY